MDRLSWSSHSRMDRNSAAECTGSIADRRGIDGRRCITQHHRPGALGGTARLSALLDGRTSWDAGIGLRKSRSDGGTGGCRYSRLHVGTGGVMLPHYSPLKVAETFSMLSGLFPGRIDLGLGRAAGTSRDRICAAARSQTALAGRFPRTAAGIVGLSGKSRAVLWTVSAVRLVAF